MTYKLRQTGTPVTADNPEGLSRSERMWLFAESHRGTVIAGVVVASLALILLGVLLWFQYQQEREALDLEQQAIEAYTDRSLDDIDAANEKLQEAVTLYRQILEEFPRTNSAQSARYFVGNALAEQQDHAGAIEVYQQFINQSGTSPVLLGLVYQRLAASYLATGEREKGIDAYTQVLQIPQTLNKDQVLFELAKLAEHEDQKDQALTRYKQVLDEYPASPYASEAGLRVKALEPPPEESDGETSEEVTEEAATEQEDVQVETPPEESAREASEETTEPVATEQEDGQEETPPAEPVGDTPEEATEETATEQEDVQEETPSAEPAGETTEEATEPAATEQEDSQEETPPAESAGEASEETTEPEATEQEDGQEETPPGE